MDKKLKKIYNKSNSFQSSKKIILQLHLQLQKSLNFLAPMNFYKENFFA